MSVMTGMPAGNLEISTPGPSEPPPLGDPEPLLCDSVMSKALTCVGGPKRCRGLCANIADNTGQREGDGPLVHTDRGPL